MKLIAVIVKSIRENIRDWKVLVLVFLFSPFFILLMKLFYGSDPVNYKIGYFNAEDGQISGDMIEQLIKVEGQDGIPLFSVRRMNRKEELLNGVKDKGIDLGLVFPEDFSVKLLRAAESGGGESDPAVVQFYGSMGNPRYLLAAVLASDAIYDRGIRIARITMPVTIKETFTEKNMPANEFESSVPGLISMSVLMILFSATASIVRENEKRTLIRLKLSSLGAFYLLAGITVVQALLAAAAIVLSYWTALSLDFRPAGTFGAVLVTGILSSFSIVALSLITAAFLNTVFDVLTVGCFPFFILMFFSGCMFPLPEMKLFSIAGIPFAVNDILPLTHTARAFHKILNIGSGVMEILPELMMITLLTVVYFAAGMLLYQRRKLSKA